MVCPTWLPERAASSPTRHPSTATTLPIPLRNSIHPFREKSIFERSRPIFLIFEKVGRSRLTMAGASRAALSADLEGTEPHPWSRANSPGSGAPLGMDDQQSISDITPTPKPLPQTPGEHLSDPMAMEIWVEDEGILRPAEVPATAHHNYELLNLKIARFRTFVAAMEKQVDEYKSPMAKNFLDILRLIEGWHTHVGIMALKEEQRAAAIESMEAAGRVLMSKINQAQSEIRITSNNLERLLQQLDDYYSHQMQQIDHRVQQLEWESMLALQRTTLLARQQEENDKRAALDRQRWESRHQELRSELSAEVPEFTQRSIDAAIQSQINGPMEEIRQLLLDNQREQEKLRRKLRRLREEKDRVRRPSPRPLPRVITTDPRGHGQRPRMSETPEVVIQPPTTTGNPSSGPSVKTSSSAEKKGPKRAPTSSGGDAPEGNPGAGGPGGSGPPPGDSGNAGNDGGQPPEESPPNAGGAGGSGDPPTRPPGGGVAGGAPGGDDPSSSSEDSDGPGGPGRGRPSRLPRRRQREPSDSPSGDDSSSEEEAQRRKRRKTTSTTVAALLALPDKPPKPFKGTKENFAVWWRRISIYRKHHPTLKTFTDADQIVWITNNQLEGAAFESVDAWTSRLVEQDKWSSVDWDAFASFMDSRFGSPYEQLNAHSKLKEHQYSRDKGIEDFLDKWVELNVRAQLEDFSGIELLKSQVPFAIQDRVPSLSLVTNLEEWINLVRTYGVDYEFWERDKLRLKKEGGKDSGGGQPKPKTVASAAPQGKGKFGKKDGSGDKPPRLSRSEFWAKLLKTHEGIDEAERKARYQEKRCTMCAMKGVEKDGRVQPPHGWESCSKKNTHKVCTGGQGTVASASKKGKKRKASTPEEEEKSEPKKAKTVASVKKVVPTNAGLQIWPVDSEEEKDF